LGKALADSRWIACKQSRRLLRERPVGVRFGLGGMAQSAGPSYSLSVPLVMHCESMKMATAMCHSEGAESPLATVASD